MPAVIGFPIEAETASVLGGTDSPSPKPFCV